MKKGKLISLCTVGLCMTLTSCFENTGNHHTAILYPPPPTGIKILYADQTFDSLVFETIDSWKLDTTYNNIPQDGKLFFSIDPKDFSGNEDSKYFVRKSIKLEFTPNTTDTYKTAVLNIKAYGGNFSAVYKQMHFHDIERPRRLNYEFLLTDTAGTTMDSIIFKAYDNWSMKIKDAEQKSWIRIANPEGSKGNQVVKINMDKNETQSNRDATIILTSSNEATTEIRIVQQKPVQKN